MGKSVSQKHFRTIEKLAPAEIGNRWPCKRGSSFRYAFQRAYEGVKAADLKAELTDAGYNFKIALQFLRNRYSGVKKITHRWELNEEDGRLKVFNVEPPKER